jgi:phage terminase large subunit-like protein
VTRRWLSWSHAWAHSIVLERRKDIKQKLEDFATAGDLTFVEKPGDDVEDVCEIVRRLEDIGLLPAMNAVGVDPVGIDAIVDRLTSPEYGIDISRIKAITQGYRMSGAIKTTERALAGNTLVHCGQLMMAWCAGNAKVIQSGNATMVTKQHSGTAKIDPLLALFNACSLMGLNPEGQGSLDDWLSSLGK